METIKEKPPNNDLPGARLKIFKAADNKYIICTTAGDYLATTDRDLATNLMLHPEARAKYLRAHGIANAKQSA